MKRHKFNKYIIFPTNINLNYRLCLINTIINRVIYKKFCLFVYLYEK